VRLAFEGRNGFGQMLSSKRDDTTLFDKSDELLTKLPEATDEIEKTIKLRIGLLQKAENVE